MKLFVITFLICFLLPHVKAEQVIVNCQGEVRMALSRCGAAHHSCGHLEQCLLKRDTCFEKNGRAFRFDPESKPACEGVNSCVATLTDRIGDFLQQCHYSWNETSRKCNVSSGGTFFVSLTCPGNRDENLISYLGNGAGEDDDFTCEGQQKSWVRWKSSCRESLAKIQKHCSNGEFTQVMEELGAANAHDKCETAEEFLNYPTGKFKINL